MLHNALSAGGLAILTLSLMSLEDVKAQEWIPRAPAARSSTAVVFDPSTKKMILFGGLPDAYITQSNLRDVFWLNNASAANEGLYWQRVAPAGTAPAARQGHTAVYDAANSRMIVFGGGLGRSSPCANDVWVLSNANGEAGTPTWTRSVPSGTPPAARLYHTAVYDPNSNRMILFGGADCFSGLFNDVWVLTNANGLGGPSSWIQLSVSGTAPSPRDGMTAVYDSANNMMIVFGGAYGNDLWVLSNANGTGGAPAWSQLTASNPPPARSSHSAVYDQTNNIMTVFGGGSLSGSLFNDVWVLSNANGKTGSPTWTQLQPPGLLLPEFRADHAAVYDADGNSMVIFGGLIDPQQVPTNDVYVLLHANGK